MVGAWKRKIPSGLKRSVLPRLARLRTGLGLHLSRQLSPCAFWTLFILCISRSSGPTSTMRSEVSCDADCLPPQLFFSPLIFPAEGLPWTFIWVHPCDVYKYIWCRLLHVCSPSRGWGRTRASSQVAASQPNFCRVSNLFSCSHSCAP